MPGVLILEAVAQTGGLLLLLDVPDRENKLLLFCGRRWGAIPASVVPGDQLRIEVKVLNWRGDFCKLEGKATVNGQLAAEGTVMCKMIDREPPGKTEETREMRMREIHPQAAVSRAQSWRGSKNRRIRRGWRGSGIGRRLRVARARDGRGPSKFGKNNTFYSFSAIGGDPQDYTFRGERTELVAGDGTFSANTSP